MMTIFYIALLFLHILLCVLTYLGIHSGLLKVHKYMFFVAVFLPFWGVLLVLVLHFQILFDGDNVAEIPMEKMKLDSDLYKSVFYDEEKNADTIVPIEEALIINSAKERRDIIMDVLNDNPKEYIEFLQKAGNNDDTEVVHYAVTAMVEISKENDYMLQNFAREYQKNPDDFETLTAYCDFLWECLNQNLMQGQVEVMNRNNFADLIKKKLSIKENKEDYIRLIKNGLKLENYTEAGELIEKMSALFPKSEEILLLRIEYMASVGRGDEIGKMLEEAEKEQTYFSAAAKEAIAFWKK